MEVNFAQERTWPEIYNVRSKGNCMEPVFASGSRCSVSVPHRPKQGDLVAVWFKPNNGYSYSPHDPHQEMHWRVSRGEACLVKILAKEEPAALTLLMLNPLSLVVIPLADVAAFHKVLGVREPDGGFHWMNDILRDRMAAFMNTRLQDAV